MRCCSLATSVHQLDLCLSSSESISSPSLGFRCGFEAVYIWECCLHKVADVMSFQPHLSLSPPSAFFPCCLGRGGSPVRPVTAVLLLPQLLKVRGPQRCKEVGPWQEVHSQRVCSFQNMSSLIEFDLQITTLKAVEIFSISHPCLLSMTFTAPESIIKRNFL